MSPFNRAIPHSDTYVLLAIELVFKTYMRQLHSTCPVNFLEVAKIIYKPRSLHVAYEREEVSDSPTSLYLAGSYAVRSNVAPPKNGIRRGSGPVASGLLEPVVMSK